jgi:hypothetical protein
MADLKAPKKVKGPATYSMDMFQKLRNDGKYFVLGAKSGSGRKLSGAPVQWKKEAKKAREQGIPEAQIPQLLSVYIPQLRVIGRTDQVLALIQELKLSEADSKAITPITFENWSNTPDGKPIAQIVQLIGQDDLAAGAKKKPAKLGLPKANAAAAHGRIQELMNFLAATKAKGTKYYLTDVPAPPAAAGVAVRSPRARVAKSIATLYAEAQQGAGQEGSKYLDLGSYERGVKPAKLGVVPAATTHKYVNRQFRIMSSKEANAVAAVQDLGTAGTFTPSQVAELMAAIRAHFAAHPERPPRAKKAGGVSPRTVSPARAALAPTLVPAASAAAAAAFPPVGSVGVLGAGAGARPYPPIGTGAGVAPVSMFGSQLTGGNL